jgi:hypothetical protein
VISLTRSGKRDMKSRDSFLVNTMFGNDDGAEVDSRLRGMQFVKF